MSGNPPRPPTTEWFDVAHDADGQPIIRTHVTGIALLRFVLTNKGTAYTPEEREALGLDGLLPPQVETLEQQVARAYRSFQHAPTPIDKYVFLRATQEQQEILFHALLERHLEEMLPIVYTPTVGRAVEEFSHLYRAPRGLSLSPLTIDRAEALVGNYPMEDVRMVVVTDSSAILGIGDQGYGGLAIPIGKLALYSAAGGVSPFHTLPAALDVGTERIDLINDPEYLGVRQRRLRGPAYDAFVDRFVDAIRHRYPRAVIQWEDLGKGSAFAVLERYRDIVCSFNDDIQGTGAVALAGVLAACRVKGERLTEQTFVIHGAGAGGIGVARQIRIGLEREGLSPEQAAARIFVLDSKGLLIADRSMEAYKRPFAQPREQIARWAGPARIPDLLETITGAEATVLLGLSGRPGAFDEAAVRAVAAHTARPVVFPLSNPTSASEAHPMELFAWTDGQALVATGSPFDEVTYGGRTHPIGQGNNAFIFPGLGMGAILSEASRVTDAMVTEAAYALAAYTAERHGLSGRLYPPLRELRAASQRVAAAVIAQAVADGVARAEGLPADPLDLADFVARRLWSARYLPVRRASEG
jgi:malate dehydrogenase (oxaloacetate-decarboxylating)